MFIGCGLQIFQQLSGINTVMYYGPEMIKQSRLFEETDNSGFVLMAAIPLAFINFLGTVIALFQIEKVGRRLIMLKVLPFCTGGMMMMSVGVYITYFTSRTSTLSVSSITSCGHCDQSVRHHSLPVRLRHRSGSHPLDHQQ